MLAFRQLPIELRAPVRRFLRVIERTKIVNRMERGERQLREHGQQVGRPPGQGGRSVGTHVEVGRLGDAQDDAPGLAPSPTSAFVRCFFRLASVMGSSKRPSQNNPDGDSSGNSAHTGAPTAWPAHAAMPYDLLRSGGQSTGSMQNWGVTVDGVMGGLSSGTASILDSSKVSFQGNVNTNGGGFVYMTRSSSGIDISQYAGISLTLGSLDAAVVGNAP